MQSTGFLRHVLLGALYQLPGMKGFARNVEVLFVFLRYSIVTSLSIGSFLMPLPKLGVEKIGEHAMLNRCRKFV
jgi:hypothetical protein